jgi:hypothetical protein
MRLIISGLTAIGFLLVAGDALAAASVMSMDQETILLQGGRASRCTPIGENGGGIPGIARGEKVGIACSEAGRAGVDVRVILEFDPAPGETPTGYGSVLVTAQAIDKGKVLVRVPDLPDIANHTVDVKVYVTDSSGTSSCDAGRIKIL